MTDTTGHAELIARLREMHDERQDIGAHPTLYGNAADALETLAKEAEHWKANHDHQVAAKRSGRQRLIDHHETALAQARKDALEEAAKVAADWRDDACLPDPSKEIAAAIRALSTKGETG